MNNHSTEIAGIDVAKAKLDIAIGQQRWQLANDEAGFATLVGLLCRMRVSRVGMEASGGYERAVAEYLRRAGFQLVILQPLQVRHFAQFTLHRAKTDRIDAGLIADCLANRKPRPGDGGPVDQRLQPLADRLTFIEQLEGDIARLKVRREHVNQPDLIDMLRLDIKQLTARRRQMLAELVKLISQHQDLAERLQLVLSIPGIGERTAIALILRLPELGSISREKAASLAGLAPFPHDSGQHQGKRHIAAGRTRVRTSLYAAALPAAFKWNTALQSLYRRLTSAGKPHKLALVACARKLLIFANTVLQRRSPWITVQQ